MEKATITRAQRKTVANYKAELAEIFAEFDRLQAQIDARQTNRSRLREEGRIRMEETRELLRSIGANP